jgi:DNA-binding GntR family transcriptional regulator
LDTLAPFDLRTLTERAYTLLRSRILTRQFAPGERLYVDRLADQLGVSRTPVKDALRRLETDGLVRLAGKKGFAVASLSWSDIEDVFDLRRALELHAARRLLDRVTEADVARLRALTEAILQHAQGDNTADYDTFVGLDRDFHLYLIDRAGNKRLAAVYRSLHIHARISHVYYARIPQSRQRVYREHAAITEAFAARDLQAVKEAVDAHIRNVVRHLREVLPAGDPVI